MLIIFLVSQSIVFTHS